jgi:hypothetical protein
LKKRRKIFGWMPSSILAFGEATEFCTKEAYFNLNLTNVKHNVRGLFG